MFHITIHQGGIAKVMNSRIVYFRISKKIFDFGMLHINQALSTPRLVLTYQRTRQIFVNMRNIILALALARFEFAKDGIMK
jgi:phage-related holin